MRIVVTGPAEADIDAMLDFIRGDSAPAAIGVATAVKDAVMSPGALPLRGRVGRMHDTRELPVRRTSLILIYRVVGETVAVLRVRHASQGWPPAR